MIASRFVTRLAGPTQNTLARDVAAALKAQMNANSVKTQELIPATRTIGCDNLYRINPLDGTLCDANPSGELILASSMHGVLTGIGPIAHPQFAGSAGAVASVSSQAIALGNPIYHGRAFIDSSGNVYEGRNQPTGGPVLYRATTQTQPNGTYLGFALDPNPAIPASRYYYSPIDLPYDPGQEEWFHDYVRHLDGSGNVDVDVSCGTYASLSAGKWPCFRQSRFTPYGYQTNFSGTLTWPIMGAVARAAIHVSGLVRPECGPWKGLNAVDDAPSGLYPSASYVVGIEGGNGVAGYGYTLGISIRDATTLALLHWEGFTPATAFILGTGPGARFTYERANNRPWIAGVFVLPAEDGTFLVSIKDSPRAWVITVTGTTITVNESIVFSGGPQQGAYRAVWL